MAGFMGDNEITITYETLFEILRREKNREDLQEMDKSFFANLVDYIRDKQKIVEKKEMKLFSDDEIEKTDKQIQNVKKIVKELYDRREKKILSMAMSKARLQNNLINTSVLLEEEKQLYDEMVAVLVKFRNTILLNVINTKLPDTGCSPQIEEEKPKELKSEALSQQKNIKTIRFLSAVPKFLGPNLEVYGPFEGEDVASLPAEVADVLVQKERAEEVKQE